jgi:hypothetical protein
VDLGGAYNTVLPGAAAAALVTNGVVVALPAVMSASVTFTGTAGVNLFNGTAATTTGFCVVGTNTNNGSSTWFTYSKAKGGLQPNSYTTQALAQAAC